MKKRNIVAAAAAICAALCLSMGTPGSGFVARGQEGTKAEEQTEGQNQTESRTQAPGETQQESQSQPQEELPESDKELEKQIQNLMEKQQLLQIDDENVYEGMDKAYKEGYEPEVSKNQVTVILPLSEAVASELQSIQVTPDFGNAKNSPFVYKNYQKTIQKKQQKIKKSKETKEIFYVKFRFDLKEERSEGTYPIQFQVAYYLNGTSAEQTFRTYVQIGESRQKEEGAEPAIVQESQETQAPAQTQESESEVLAEPKLIIEKSRRVPERIVAGQEFELQVTIKNTNKKKYVQNITATVSNQEPNLVLQEESNTFYFDYLGPQETLTLNLKFKAEAQIAEGSYSVGLDFSYDNSDAVPLTASGKMDFKVYQELRIGFEAGDIQEEMNAGDSIAVPIQVMNLGRSGIYNAVCTVEAPGLSVNQSLYLGNLESGAAASGEMQIFAGMVNPQAQSEEERYGRTDGHIILTYEDQEGKVSTQKKEIATVIKALEIRQETEEGEEKEQGLGGQVFAGFSVVLLLLLGMASVPAVKAWRRKRQVDDDERLL